METECRTEPPSPEPAWRWLYVLVLGAIAWVILVESVEASTPLRGAVELVTALATTGGLIAWVRANRAALLARETGGR